MKSDFPRATIVDSHVRMLHSNVVDDDYELSIYLPPSYAASEQVYPTLYILDPPTMFGSVVAAVLHQNWDSVIGVPEMIVVGIGKRIDSLEEWWPVRERDYVPTSVPDNPASGHAESFLAFFEQELIPFIDSNYRTDPNDRIVLGVSMGGIFVLYAMFNRAQLFNRYISICPSFALGGKTVFDFRSALATASFSSEVRLFVAVGSADHEFRPNVEAFMRALSEKPLANLKFQTLVVEGLGHAPAAVPAFYYGIEAVYA